MDMCLESNADINFEELAQIMDYYEYLTPQEKENESSIPDELIVSTEDAGLISYRGFVVLAIVIIYLGSLIAIAILKAKGYSTRLV